MFVQVAAAVSRRSNPLLKPHAVRCVALQTRPQHRFPRTQIVRRTSNNQAKDFAHVQTLIAEGKKSELHNITDHVQSMMDKNLHLRPGHPINIIKTLIEDFFHQQWSPTSGEKMAIYDNLSPIITTHQAFDELLFEPHHPGRSPTDTYYVTPNTVLRPHTSAHQNELLKSGVHSFLCTGDVDTIDTTHFPVFHQMEGLHIIEESLLSSKGDDAAQVEFVANELKHVLEAMAKHIFGDVETRWVGEFFPFTNPSFELEICYQGEWMEVLGCGVIHQQLLQNCGLGNRKGWAFGLGLERLAMVLFSIPDIRLFWSEDPRFTTQFEADKISSSSGCWKLIHKDIAFWIPPNFEENGFYELVRYVAGDLVEDVKLVDSFVHPKTQKKSMCFRINYRSMERSLTNEEVDKLQFQLRDEVTKKMNVEIR